MRHWKTVPEELLRNTVNAIRPRKNACATKIKSALLIINITLIREWGKSQNYHLTLDSSRLGIDKCTDIITGLVH